ncbi:hypothetical protein V502_00854 [Pseudogymnoascus sp. VKM F-4520 (FW-2644)]|nr:hypothetical protein V502_00854 [Pseudogymnoascus sp. VKM F-4520 (FW-2644)]
MSVASSYSTTSRRRQDMDLLSLKEIRPKLMWVDILREFSTKWSDKTWTIPLLQMRWTRLKPRQPQVQTSRSLPVPQMPSPLTMVGPSNNETTNRTSMGPPTTTPPMHGLRFNSLSTTYNEYVPLELSTFAKFKQRGAGSLLGIMYYWDHPIQWISIIGTISSVESISFVDVATIADANTTTTTLKCAWSFPAGSTQPVSDHLRHTSPPLRLGNQYRYCSPMEALRPKMDVLATGRLGRYNDQICLHIHYMHHLSAHDAVGFRRKAAAYKGTTLEHSWVLASSDQTDVTPSYEETFIRILTSPMAEVVVDVNSTISPAADWKCQNPDCLKYNHNYCREFSSAWGRLSSTNQGYYSPRLSWITSTGPASKADDAHTSRKQKRQSEKARDLREGRDWFGLDVRLASWMENCPICHVRKMAGHDIDAAHKLETCIDEKREIVSLEIAKLQEIKFAVGVSCQLCAVPQETCHDSMYFTRQGEEKCLYDGVVREAVTAIMVAGPGVVVEKMYAWMRSEGYGQRMWH